MYEYVSFYHVLQVQYEIYMFVVPFVMMEMRNVLYRNTILFKDNLVCIILQDSYWIYTSQNIQYM